MAPLIDLNADLGEGMGDDAALLAVVTSANIAAGGHAGDAESMRVASAAAVARGVAIGAHVSYPDRAGFGRRPMEIAAAELAELVTEQVLTLEDHAAAEGGAVSYVKPHGALYNRIVHDEHQAEVVARAVAEAAAALARPLALLSLPESVALAAAARSRLDPVAEAFADRAYTPRGTLVPRSQPGAVIAEPEAVVARSVATARGEEIEAADGTKIRVAARSLCVHGDTPGAAALAARVRAALDAAGVGVEAFAGPE